MDRTEEFFETINIIRSNKNKNFRPTPPKKKSVRSRFATSASSLGADLVKTTSRLEELSRLAKRRTLFEDPTVEVQQLSSAVSDDIKRLKQQLAELRSMPAPTRGRDAGMHVSSVIEQLGRQLNTTAHSFQDALETRTQSMKAQQRDRERLSGLSDLASRSPLLYAPHSSHGVSPSSALVPMVPAQDEVSIAINDGQPQGQQQQQQQQLRLVPLRPSYLASRAEAVAAIERSIAELKSIFEQLAAMVVQQGELMERIDLDVMITEDHLEVSEAALLKYARSQAGNRWLYIKVFTVLLFFIVAFFMLL